MNVKHFIRPKRRNEYEIEAISVSSFFQSLELFFLLPFASSEINESTTNTETFEAYAATFQTTPDAITHAAAGLVAALATTTIAIAIATTLIDIATTTKTDGWLLHVFWLWCSRRAGNHRHGHNMVVSRRRWPRHIFDMLSVKVGSSGCFLGVSHL